MRPNVQDISVNPSDREEFSSAAQLSRLDEGGGRARYARPRHLAGLGLDLLTGGLSPPLAKPRCESPPLKPRRTGSAFASMVAFSPVSPADVDPQPSTGVAFNPRDTPEWDTFQPALSSGLDIAIRDSSG
jgi:hypothetical protein